MKVAWPEGEAGSTGGSKRRDSCTKWFEVVQLALEFWFKPALLLGVGLALNSSSPPTEPTSGRHMEEYH